ncbi:hypothetical protein DEO72_LG8g708 [Vigna unguiculata]|uniref:Uncharacterized protein n=1 Tax=Vigna unguiculata TaxID=3917 RepID=A0A4D6MMU6_VIGUN|nr:hypothetical protein DEO72_LG8g708 [Vigna unguiculata]
MAPKIDIQQVLSPFRKPPSGGSGTASSSSSTSASSISSSTSNVITKPLTIQQIFGRKKK